MIRFLINHTTLYLLCALVFLGCSRDWGSTYDPEVVHIDISVNGVLIQEIPQFDMYEYPVTGERNKITFDYGRGSRDTVFINEIQLTNNGVIPIEIALWTIVNHPIQELAKIEVAPDKSVDLLAYSTFDGDRLLVPEIVTEYLDDEISVNGFTLGEGICKVEVSLGSSIIILSK